jgi:hypothetical protein
VPLPVFLTRPAESHALIQSHVVTHDRGLTDDYSQPMINEQSSSDLGSGMDFDSGQESRYLREPSRKQPEAMAPQPMIDAVEHSVQPE